MPPPPPRSNQQPPSLIFSFYGQHTGPLVALRSFDLGDTDDGVSSCSLSTHGGGAVQAAAHRPFYVDLLRFSCLRSHAH